MRLTHWHTMPISCLHHIFKSSIFYISTTNHTNISMLSKDNRVTMQHINHANKYFEQSSYLQIFKKYKTGSCPDPPLHWSHRPQQFSSNLTAFANSLHQILSNNFKSDRVFAMPLPILSNNIKSNRVLP